LGQLHTNEQSDPIFQQFAGDHALGGDDVREIALSLRNVDDLLGGIDIEAAQDRPRSKIERRIGARRLDDECGRCGGFEVSRPCTSSAEFTPRSTTAEPPHAARCAEIDPAGQHA
jgi:hypothetical protein